MSPFIKATLKRRNGVAVHFTALCVLGAGTLALSVGLGGCKRGGSDPPAGPQATKASAQTIATQVGVTAARVGAISEIQPVTGALSAQNDVTVGAKLAGKVAAVYYREGDVVKRGAIVVQQDPADLQAQLEQQRANLSAAETRLSQAHSTLQSAQTNLRLTDEQTRSAVAEAQAALEAARQQYLAIKNGARVQERQQAKQAVAQAVADRDSAKADRDSAQANLVRAQQDLKRYQGLYRQQAVSAQQLDQAQSTADSAQAAVTAADARIVSAQARVDSQQQALSLIQAGNRSEDVLRAQATVDQSRQALVTAQANRSQVNLRRADVDNAQAGIANAEAQVQQAQAAVRLAKQGLEDAAVRSPMDGVVAERKIEPGAQIGAGKDVMRIVALDSIYFDAQLPEALYTAVTVGKSVNVNVSAFPNRTFRGLVSKIFPVASSAARNFTVRIALLNEGNLLRPQMFAQGTIILNTHSHAVLVPRDAVLDNNGTSGRVFVVDKNIATEHPVKLGYANLKDIEITSGVKAGDLVVTSGQAQLQNDSPVQILNENSTPSATTP